MSGALCCQDTACDCSAKRRSVDDELGTQLMQELLDQIREEIKLADSLANAYEHEIPPLAEDPDDLDDIKRQNEAEKALELPKVEITFEQPDGSYRNFSFESKPLPFRCKALKVGCVSKKQNNTSTDKVVVARVDSKWPAAPSLKLGSIVRSIDGVALENGLEVGELTKLIEDACRDLPGHPKAMP
eukprot:TRINITY_DN84059_c0_g1_i1.p1 TRINITY_DN84059_c0_g1~~TRINITY_DN84059_c0_g1_i1.p1  ORF type:complete len:186 (+),score=29.01 TRINITY_DN84059_c0_g1_i1:54-611(+)